MQNKPYFDVYYQPGENPVFCYRSGLMVYEEALVGGARTDLGMMKSFNHTWVSDWQNLPRSAMITSGLTMALPPERVDRLFAGMGCHAFGSFDAQMRNTMLTHMSLNVVAPAATYANPVQMEFIRRSVRLYKDFIRPLLPVSKVFHHTPDVKDALKCGATILELAAPDRTRGVIGVFAMTKCGEQAIDVCSRGIDPSKTYRVTLDNTQSTFEIPGHALCQNGIRIQLPAALTSELVLFEAIS